MNIVTNQRTPRTSRRQPPIIPQGEVIADFKQYPDALAFVDNLIKNNFPAESVAIVGSDLRTVERVRGKINYTRLALSGATTGAWIGLIFGILFTGNVDPADPNTYTSINSAASSVVIGAGLGMLLSVVRYSLSRNKRTFVSQSSVVAAKYQIQVPAHLADKARAIPKA
ncbi:MAG: hypothetical protein RL100_863 [Actinomycetota bacterium]|jgi:hypothetical protein